MKRVQLIFFFFRSNEIFINHYESSKEREFPSVQAIELLEASLWDNTLPVQTTHIDKVQLIINLNIDKEIQI